MKADVESARVSSGTNGSTQSRSDRRERSAAEPDVHAQNTKRLDRIDLIGREWDYLDDGTSHLFVGLVAAIGALLIMFESNLVAVLDLYGAGIKLSALGLWLLALAALSYALSQFYRRAAAYLLVVGVTGAVLVAAFWWPDRDLIFLLPFALVLALLHLSVANALWLILITGAVLLTPIFAPILVARPGQGVILLGLMGAIWVAGLIDWHVRTTFLSFLYRSYQQAQAQLRSVREHRMVLNQTNQELADAYVEIQRLNKLLQASRIEAETARRSKEDFVANVSHELRTPLNMIIGFTEMIMHSPSTYGDHLPRSLLSDIRVIYRNSQHLSQMINDVLDLSRVEAGQLVLSRGWVDLRTIVREATQAINPLYKSKGLALEVEMPDAELAAFCDKLRIRQILLNLLSNAGRYTDAGGTTVTVRAGDTQIVCTVADTGPGIPPQDREHLFEPFHQPEDVDRAMAGGSGLGLSICKKLVELHGGRIWLEDAGSTGTAISFSVPIKLPEMAPSPAVGWLSPYRTMEPRQHVSMPKLPSPRDRFVILERQDMLRRRFAALLTGADVIGVDNLDALQQEVARVTPTALVINGIEAMEDKRYSHRFQSLPERMPIISCYVPGREEALEKLNVVEYLVKPIARSDLLAVTRQVTPVDGSILIVENELEMALLIRRQLENADRGYRIIQVADGRNALQSMRERQPNLILLDLALPDQDGYQVLHEKNLDPVIRNIPVVVISARDPVGEPVMAGRLRVELVGGLSSRDIVRGVDAISRTFSSIHRSENSASAETLPG